MNQPMPLYLRVIVAIVSIAILVTAFTFFSVFVFALFGLGLVASIWRLITSRSSSGKVTVEPSDSNIYYEREQANTYHNPPVIEIEGKVIK